MNKSCSGGAARLTAPQCVACARAEPTVMVNYKRVVCETVLLAAVLGLATAAPAPHDCRETHYDQRQNGTENYRLNIDGVVIAVAPAESLLSAASDIDFNDLFDLEEFADLQKPPKPTEDKPIKPSEPLTPPDTKPQDSKPEAKPDEAPLNDVSLNSEASGQKKEAPNKKQEKAQRLKHRLASILMPLLRKTRHH